MWKTESSQPESLRSTAFASHHQANRPRNHKATTDVAGNVHYVCQASNNHMKSFVASFRRIFTIHRIHRTFAQSVCATWQIDTRTALQARGYFARFDEISKGTLAHPANTPLESGTLHERLGKVDATVSTSPTAAPSPAPIYRPEVGRTFCLGMRWNFEKR
jgi:hypothetical protein